MRRTSPARAGSVADLERAADGRPTAAASCVDGRLDPGPDLEQLAGDGVLGRVEGGAHGAGEVLDEDEVAGLLAVAVDLDRLAAPRAARSQAATTLRLWSEHGP